MDANNNGPKTVSSEELSFKNGVVKHCVICSYYFGVVEGSVKEQIKQNFVL